MLSIPPSQTSKFENVLQSLGVADDYGPIEISSTNDLPLVARSTVSSRGRVVGAFEGLSQAGASMEQVIPLLASDFESGASLGINNLSDVEGNVVVRLIGSDGTQLGNVSASIPGKGLLQMADILRALGHSPGTSAAGSGLRVESTQPIYSWLSRMDPSTHIRDLVVGENAGESLRTNQ
jgi:hypothetical protein